MGAIRLTDGEKGVSAPRPECSRGSVGPFKWRFTAWGNIPTIAYDERLAP